MADAIRKSACVIVFITKRYIDKASGNGPNGSDDNCKFEFDSAPMSKHLGVDKIITVVMEPRCKNPMVWPDGTVKGKLAPKLYIDMSSDDALRDNMPALLKEIAEVTGKGLHCARPPRSLTHPSPAKAISWRCWRAKASAPTLAQHEVSNVETLAAERSFRRSPEGHWELSARVSSCATRAFNRRWIHRRAACRLKSTCSLRR